MKVQRVDGQEILEQGVRGLEGAEGKAPKASIEGV